MSKCKDSLWRKCLQIYLKRTLPYTHLQILVDKQPKKQFFCELSENFETAIVIKASFCVSAVFSRSHTLTLLVSIKNKVLLLIFKINEIKNSNINPYRANFSYRFFAMCSQSTQQTLEQCYAQCNLHQNDAKLQTHLSSILMIKMPNPALKIKFLVLSVKMSGRTVFWSDMSCSYFPKFSRT